MRYLEINQHTYVEHGCPVSGGLDPDDDLAEIVIGANGQTIRLGFHDPGTMRRIAHALSREADRLDGHLATPVPARAALAG
ncbi:hypothetical protein BLA60_21355 [Actinophytocola xinjiangensis]|uniref:Uncharacterized protein n=1 Tax=Actinophytocola xinjiangensis TaxID=485602 RepID=A0A7Z0WKX8_9PSEU|nr:hypothetical protein [Actinophytocola xinjiangensis]OLF09124.1 hypothetical protein BLA60_21355 [Actinophytocola xinjiangensis]